MTPSIDRLLAGITLRMRIKCIFQYITDGLWVTLLVGAPVVAIRQLFSKELSLQYIGIGLAIFLLLYLLIRVRLNWPNHYEAARLADSSVELDDRLTTTFELSQLNHISEFEQLQIADTSDKVRRFKPKECAPWALPQRFYMFVPMAGLVIAAWFVPPLPSSTATTPQMMQKTLKKEGKQLEKLAKEIKMTEQDEDLKKLAEELESLSQKLQKNKHSPNEAMKRLALMEERIKEVEKRREDQLSKLGKTDGFLKDKKNNGKTGKDPDLSKLKQEELNSLQDAIDALSKAGATAPQTQKRDAEQLAKDLAKMLGQLSSEMAMGNINKEQAEEIAKTMEQLSQEMKKNPEMKKLSEDLKKAAENLRKGDCKQGNKCPNTREATQKMRDAANELRKMAGKSKNADALAKMMAQLQLAQQKIRDQNLKSCSKGCKKQGRGWGTESTNKEGESFNSEPRASDNRQKDQAPIRKEDWEALYDPKRLQKTGFDTKLHGEVTQEGENQFLLIPGAPGDGKSLALDSGAGVNYEQPSLDSISQEKIPKRYQGAVKDYFESLTE